MPQGNNSMSKDDSSRIQSTQVSQKIRTIRARTLAEVHVLLRTKEATTWVQEVLQLVRKAPATRTRMLVAIRMLVGTPVEAVARRRSDDMMVERS